MKRWFLTVDRCGEGRRGVFCNTRGTGYSSEIQHTRDEMGEILGVFELILNPQSVLLTEDELAEYNRWLPLDEYSQAFGVAYRKQDLRQGE